MQILSQGRQQRVDLTVTRWANRVARRMVVPPYREGGQAQFIERPVPETTRDSKINALLASLRQNLDQPQDLDSLSRTLSMGTCLSPYENDASAFACSC